MFGIYKHDKKLPLPVFDFIAKNVLYLSKIILEENILAIITNTNNIDFLSKKNQSKDNIAFVKFFSNPVDKFSSVLYLNTNQNSLPEILETIGPDQFFIALWSIIIHETRHIIQKYYFKDNIDKLMRIHDLKLIHEHNPNVARWIIKEYISVNYPNLDIKKHEFDAIVIECLSSMLLIDTFNEEEKFFKNIVEILLLEQDEIQLILEKMISREPPQKTPSFNLTYSFELSSDEPIVMHL